MKTLKIFGLKSYLHIFELDWSPSFSYRKGLNKFLKIGYSIQSQMLIANVYNLSSSKNDRTDDILIAACNIPCPKNIKLQ